jgi:non-ribosomal peptide synthetase component E (peptide arylation enzyme)
MISIEALYQRAPVSPDGAAFIVGDDKWKYGWLAAQAERLARGLTGRGIRKRRSYRAATTNSSAQQSARALVILVTQDPRMQTAGTL